MASRLFGLLFSQNNPNDLIDLSKQEKTEEYLTVGTTKKVISFLNYNIVNIPSATGDYVYDQGNKESGLV